MENTSESQVAKNFKEVAVLAAVNHPNIVKYYRCHQVGNELWVVMESMEGGSLEDLHEVQTFEEPQLAYIAKQVSLSSIMYCNSHTNNKLVSHWIKVYA